MEAGTGQGRIWLRAGIKLYSLLISCCYLLIRLKRSWRALLMVWAWLWCSGVLGTPATHISLLGVTRGRLKVLKLAGSKKYPKNKCKSNARANTFVLQSNAFTSPRQQMCCYKAGEKCIPQFRKVTLVLWRRKCPWQTPPMCFLFKII